MKIWKAILLTVSLLIAYIALFLFSISIVLIVTILCGSDKQSDILYVTSGILRIIYTLMVVCISIWVALDSQKIKFFKYESGIAFKSRILFFACLLLWIVFFPWYLSVRYNIKNGLAELKEIYRK